MTSIRFTKSLKSAWLEKLRNPETKQTRGALHRTVEVCDDRPQGYCCLGVLATCIPEWTEEPTDSGLGRFVVPEGGWGTHFLPATLHLPDGDTLPEDHLVRMNDGAVGEKPHSFAEIADYIEENIPAFDD